MLRYDPMYDGLPKNMSKWPQLRDFVKDLKLRMQEDDIFIMRVCSDGSGGMSIVKAEDAWGDSNPFPEEEYAFYVAAEYKEVV
jgi:hypothetical protein